MEMSFNRSSHDSETEITEWLNQIADEARESLEREFGAENVEDLSPCEITPVDGLSGGYPITLIAFAVQTDREDFEGDQGEIEDRPGWREVWRR